MSGFCGSGSDEGMPTNRKVGISPDLGDGVQKMRWSIQLTAEAFACLARRQVSRLELKGTCAFSSPLALRLNLKLGGPLRVP
jgi:hypothetical protein